MLRLANASGLAPLCNSGVCVARFLAGAAGDESLDLARVFVFVVPGRVRAPRLSPFGLASPRLICRLPDGLSGSEANLPHLCSAAHRLDAQRRAYTAELAGPHSYW